MIFNEVSQEEIAKINSTLFFKLPSVRTEIGIIFGGETGNEQMAALAADLYERGAIERIIVSGGNYQAAVPLLQREFQVLKRVLLDRGVPQKQIITEQDSTNTGENVRFSLPLGLSSAQSITAICRTPHQRRVLMTMRKHLPTTPITIATYLPGSEGGITVENWTQAQFLKQFILKEFEKVGRISTNGLPDYVAQGYCAEVNIPEERDRLMHLPPMSSPML